MVVYRVGDGSAALGGGATKAFSVTVLGDTTAPMISSVTPSLLQLWPPNKPMVPVLIGVTVTDNLDPQPVCKVTSVSSNESTSADWQITGPLTVNLRADREEEGPGRV